ncbi:DNA repair protein RadC [Pseudomonas putida S16]|nr:DNA repair protein RadC [Pseudomonas putida S16]
MKFGGLRQLLEADREAFVGELGLGPVRYSQLQALLEIGRRHLATSIERESAMDSPATVRRYLKAMLRHEVSEVFGCLFLDTKHRPLAFEILFRGTIDRASVYPREVVRRALLHNAAALILCHNHPSGNSEPSQDDVHLTLSLKRGLALIDVRVLDHIIIGDGEPLSMVEHGWIVA